MKYNDLKAIVEAEIYAPSATNKQPWHFMVIQNEAFHVFYNSPTVILISGDENNNYAAVDCAAAVQNMLIAAESLKIGSCWIGFIAYLLNSEEGKSFVKELGIPEGFKQIHAVALGHKESSISNGPARKENTVNYIK